MKKEDTGNPKSAKKHFSKSPMKPKAPKLKYFPVQYFKLTEKELEVKKLLVDRYPIIFNINDLKPLAIGIHLQIHKDLLDAGIVYSKNTISRILRLWCGSITYLKTLVTSQYRYDIYGEQVHEIKEVEKKTTMLSLNKYIAKLKSKKE